MATGAVPAHAGKPTGRIPSYALPEVAVRHATDPDVLTWAPRARFLIGGTNTPKAIVDTLVRELLAETSFDPGGADRTATAGAVAMAAFKQARGDYSADVKKVSDLAKVLDARLSQQPSASDQEINDAALALLKALEAENVTTLPTPMTNVAVRFSENPHLSPSLRDRFRLHAQDHGFRYQGTSPAGQWTNQEAVRKELQWLMATAGLGGETVPIGVLDARGPGDNHNALGRQPGVATRVESVPQSGDPESRHPSTVLQMIGGTHNAKVRLARIGFSDAEFEALDNDLKARYPGMSDEDRSARLSKLQEKVAADNLESLTKFSPVVSASLGCGPPAVANVILNAINQNPGVTFVFAAGNSGQVLEELAASGKQLEHEIRQNFGDKADDIFYLEFVIKVYAYNRAESEYASISALGNTTARSKQEYQKLIAKEAYSALSAYHLSLFAKHKNVIVVGAGDLAGGVASYSARDPSLVDISAPGTVVDMLPNKPVGARSQINEGTSHSVPAVAMAVAYGPKLSLVPTKPGATRDPGLLPEKLKEVLIATAHQDSRFALANRAKGLVDPNFHRTLWLVGKYRAVIQPAPQNETSEQASVRLAAEEKKLREIDSKLRISNEDLQKIAPLALEMARRVNARLRTAPH